MGNWGNFYFMVGSAAAGLTGLTFIAVTFGSRLITEDKLAYVEAFFSPIADHFIQAFVLCAVALIPIAGPKILGAAIILTTAVRFVQLAHTHRLTKAAAAEIERHRTVGLGPRLDSARRRLRVVRRDRTALPTGNPPGFRAFCGVLAVPSGGCTSKSLGNVLMDRHESGVIDEVQEAIAVNRLTK